MAKSEEDGGLIPPVGYVHQYTKQELVELMRCKSDVVYFVKTYMKLKHPKHGALKFHPYAYQEEFLKLAVNNPRVIGLLSRQCGKTAIAAALVLWWAIFKDDQYILLLSKDQGGADEIMERVFFGYQSLPWFLKPPLTKNDVRTRAFANGSKVVASATTATSGRGLSVSLLYVDELAFVRPSIADAFWASVQPTLSTGGSAIITSTPASDENLFARLWFGAELAPTSDIWVDNHAAKHAITRDDDEEDDYETIYETEEIKDQTEALNLRYAVQDGDNDDDDDEDMSFVSFHAHWTSVPLDPKPANGVMKYRGEAFKRNILKQGLSLTDWDVEFECNFSGGSDTLISGSKLASLRSIVREPRFVDKWGCRWYTEILPNTPYAVVMDPSGDGLGDDAAIQVWEIPTLTQVAEWNSHEADQNEQARMLRRVLMRLSQLQNRHPDHSGAEDIYYSVERNSIGIGIIRAIEYMGEENFPGFFIDASEVSLSSRGESTRASGISAYRGLLTTNATKRRYAQDFKQLVERNLFVPRSRFLASQMKNFVKTGPSWAAKEGTKDDLMMSAVLMCHLIDELRFQEPDLDDYVRPIIEEDYDPDDPTLEQNQAMLPMV